MPIRIPASSQYLVSTSGVIGSFVAFARAVHADGAGEEVDRALGAGATILGVNSRDLDTFRIDTAAAWTVLRAVPPTCIAVAESGMASVTDVAAAAGAGADAVLIGTALSATADPDALLARLSRVPRRDR